MSEQRADAQAVIDLVKDLHDVSIEDAETVDGTGLQYAIVPKGMRMESIKPLIDEYLERPVRTKGTADLQTIESLIAHANRFGDARSGSALFAERQADGLGADLTAVYDYDTITGPDNREHRARYAFPLSREWKRWHRINGQKLDVSTFAELLEDRIEDVLDPAGAGDGAKGFAERLGYQLATPAKLLALSKGLSIHVESKVTAAKKLSSGEGNLVFEETHQDADGSALKIPGGFVLAIPVFEGGGAYQIPVRLRYRVRSGSIVWECHLSKVAEVFRFAIKEACDKAAAETGLPLFYGCPE